ncbi:MAG TPA: site-specific integrase [Planctomycetaceae bacterium]|nr:site-specific integrase [Planctomycetaceae bacterium]
MATYRKSGNKIRVELCVLGVRKSDTFFTKSEARVWAAKTETDIRNGKTGKAGVNKTVGDLLDRWESEKGPKDRSEASWLRQFKNSSLAPIKLADLTTQHFASWVDERLQHVCGSTVNRGLNFLSSILNTGRKVWGWHTHTHLIKDLDRPSNPNHRTRLVTDDEAYAVTVHLGFEGTISKKTHLVACFFLISIETGLRLGELCKLREKEVHIDKEYLTVLAKNAKTKKDRHVPLSPRAIELLKIRFAHNDVHVASGCASTTFTRATDQLGIDGLHFHDARHTAVTRLAKKLPVLDLALAIGHTNISQLLTYYNESATNIAKLLA